MNLLLIGDVHLSDRAPSSCTETYAEDLFTLLHHTVRIANEEKVDAVVYAGDVFHHKQPNRTSHRTVQRMIDVLAAYNCPVYITPGNHDLQSDRIESINETQPIGVLFKAGAKMLNGWADNDNLPLYGVPWLQTWDQPSVERATRRYREAEAPGLIVTHAPFYPPGYELPYEFYPTQEWARAVGGGGWTYYGHVHDAHGFYQVEGHGFANAGAISRGSLHESDLTRRVAVTIWDSKTGFRRVEVPHRPAEEVFRVIEVSERKDAQARLDEFLASIDAAEIEITSIESVIEHVRQMQVDPEVEALVVRLLQEAT